MNTSATFSTLSHATRAFILSGALAALFSPAVQAEQAQYRPAATSSATGLSRAEVVADTHLWIRAGVDKYADQAQYHADTTQYDRALAEYHRLRNSPAYAEEVARVELQRGEAPATRLSQQGAAN
ncbi:DUF4148 domain-containing protein [Aquabacterium sp.]|uniref:DUF4148 domain-containing protein n=1 Tax=Aquabacterium sp. TaxID=1872578 RepID=UPI003D6D2826